MNDYYPWPGKYSTGNPESNIAIVTLDEDFSFNENDVAIWGPMKTENLGIEKVVANTISNPNIRYLIVCGNKIRGHKSGRSFISFYENGVDDDGRIIEAPGAVPYIENISEEAVIRFREQVEIFDFIGVTEKDVIVDLIDDLKKDRKETFGEPFIAIEIKRNETKIADTDFSLHSSLSITKYGFVKKREVEEDV